MTRISTMGMLLMNKSAALIMVVFTVSIAFVPTAHAAGELDPSFGNGGKVITDFFARSDFANDMLVQPDGKVLVVGTTTVLQNNVVSTDFGLSRYNSDGSLDSSFGTGGRVSTDFFTYYDNAYAVALQFDGKIVVVGWTLNNTPFPQQDFAVARYNSDGTLDSTFGSGGKTTVDFATMEDDARAVVIQPDNKIVIGGTARVNNGPSHGNDFALARLNSDGSLDTSFDGDGRVTTNFPINGFPEDSLKTLALYPDGRILAGGATFTNGDFALARYNPNGSLDTTFDSDGRLATDFRGDGNQDEIFSAVVLQDGKILAAGSSTINHTGGHSFALARYNVDGSLDPTFDGDGRVSTSPPIGIDEIASDVAISTDGKIVVAGANFAFARFHSNGSPDVTFGSRGRFYSYLSHASAVARAITLQSDGKILAAGEVPTSGVCQCGDFVVARYKANPTSAPVRSDFDGDGKADVAVFRPSEGTWYVLNSSNGAVHAEPFGTNGDIPVPGDYDGDAGITDFAVFRPSNGTWYIKNSLDGSVRYELFGTNGDIPVAADYDGDLKTDIAVFRPSNGTWYVRRSSDNVFQTQPFGVSTDRPRPADFDGDGKADIAVFREGNGRWYVLPSTTNLYESRVWGQSGDLTSTGDFDADGKYDLAVFRPSTGYWYILMATSGIFYRWGTAGDVPVPADYTGDFLTDLAVWRPSNGAWHYFGGAAVFGVAGDVPVAGAYLP